MTPLACAICGKDSGNSLVCPECMPLMNDNQKRTVMRLWHKTIVLNANSQCEYCGHSAEFESGELCGDHIETQGARPDLRYDITNGKCTCMDCHNKRHAGNISPHSTMKENKEKQARKHKKPTCKVDRCRMFPSPNGLCARHQKSR